MKKKILMALFFISVLIYNCPAQTEIPVDKNVSILEEIKLGNAMQWIHARGTDRDNPVLLFLHGGPGMSSMPYAHFDSKLLQERFIVVHWDQLGAGKSFRPGINPKDLTTERFLNDTYELIQILKKRFNKKKIFLIGHSWGSVLGLYTAINHPEDLYAYIGMGQVVDLLQGEIDGYNFTMQKALELNDTSAVRTLKEIGLPPFEGGMQSLIKHRILLGKFGGAFKNKSWTEIVKIRMASPYYTKADQENFMKAYGFTHHCMWNDYVMKVNFFNERPELKIPVYFFEGRYDFGTPFALVEKYIKIINAPHKEIIWFENSGHFPNLEETQKYQQQLIEIAKRLK